MFRKSLLIWFKHHIILCAVLLIFILVGAMAVMRLMGFINDIPTAVDVLLAISGGLVALYGAYIKDMRNRKESFRESSIYMNKHYPIVARYATEIEDRRFKGARDGIASSYTVCDRGWIPEKLTPFSEIEVILVRDCYDSYDTVFDGTDSESPILLKKDTCIELRRGVSHNRAPENIQKLLDKLYERGNLILPYKFKTFAQNVQLISGRNVIPYPSFALTEIDTKEGVKMTVRLGNYDDFYNTCVFSLYELTHDVFANGDQKILLDISNEKSEPDGDDKGRIFEDSKKLCYRKAIDTTSFDNRFASIGINTLTILKNLPDIDYGNKDAVKKILNDDKTVIKDCKKGDFFIMHIRGNDVAEGPGLYHVIPAGSYQPTEIKKGGKTAYMNLDPTSTVIKEFAEEVLKEGGSNDLISKGWIKDIYDRLEHELYFLGVALEPVNLKTEVLSVLVIDVEKTNCQEVNIIESIGHFGENVEGKIKLHPLRKEFLEQYRDNLRTAPAGRAILSLFMEKEYDFDDGSRSTLFEY